MIAGILVFAAANPLAAGVLRYDIEPGAQYTYIPSPESLGVPGCDRSDFQCDFGLEGSFSVMIDPDTKIATLLDVDLTLIGNDQVQQETLNPFLTAEGVADWLEDRSFEKSPFPIGGPFEMFGDETHPGLVLTDSQYSVTLFGGFNHTAFDGEGVNFALKAKLVPEPSSVVLLAIGLAFALIWRRTRCVRRWC